MSITEIITGRSHLETGQMGFVGNLGLDVLGRTFLLFFHSFMVWFIEQLSQKYSTTAHTAATVGTKASTTDCSHWALAMNIVLRMAAPRRTLWSDPRTNARAARVAHTLLRALQLDLLILLY